MKSLFNGLPLAGKIISALLALALLVWTFFFVRDLLIGNRVVEARLDAGRAEATAETARDQMERLDDLRESDAVTDEQVKDIKEDIEAAETPEEAERAARAGLCRIDPKYCEASE